tara:strand:- start:247 stop:495 length:249 start_codon:yes stop_codon:yes gene_type:complete
MVDLEDQVVVVLGIYQAQIQLQQVDRVILLLLVLRKDKMGDMEDIMDQLTLYQEVGVVLEEQEIMKEVVDQQVMEQVMEGME